MIASMNPSLAVTLQVLGSTVIVGLVALVLFFSFGRSNGKRSPRKFLPGPRPWPIVGNLPLLSPHLHHDFKKLSDRYGPIFRLHLGSVYVIVISSPDLAEEVLKTKDVIFASRPTSSFGSIVFYDHSNIGFSSYGPPWRHARKVYTLELMTVKRIRQFEKKRTAELLRALDSIFNGCKDGKTVQIDHILWTITSNNICRMALGKSYSGDTSRTASVLESRVFEETVRDILRLMTASVLGDFIPFLRNFDIGGYKKQMREVAGKSDQILENIIEEHRHDLLGRTDADAEGDDKRDLVDVLLTTPSSDNENPLTREQVKGLLLEVLLAGIDTQATTLSWVFSELLRNPSIMARAQEELDSVIGHDRLVQEADLPHLPYIQAIANETFRLHPVVPLLVPHVSSEASELGNEYYVPKNSRVFINAWAMGRDPTLWENPLEFNPGRFLKTDIDSSGKAFQFLPFGSGRRTCPGRPLALTMVEYSLAVLLHACKWALPEGMSAKDVDMREASGLAVHRMTPLEVAASPRLPLPVIFAAR